jgi:hypothetical protein
MGGSALLRYVVLVPAMAPRGLEHSQASAVQLNVYCSSMIIELVPIY